MKGVLRLKSALSDALRVRPTAIRAAMPPAAAPCAGTTMIAPLVIVTVTNVVVPLPRASETFFRPMVTTPVAAFLRKVNEPLSRCPAASRLTPLPATRTPRSTWMLTSSVVSGVEAPAICTVWVARVVFSRTSKDPEKATPGTSMATVAATRPTMPPLAPAVAPMIFRVPEPLLTMTTSRSGDPSRRPRLAKETVRSVTGDAGIEPSVASRVRLSTRRSVVNRCPPISMFSPVRAAEKYGPAGRVSASTWPSTTNSSSTATGITLVPTVRRSWLISTVTSALTGVMPSPRRRDAVALMLPATPSGVTRNSAVPWVTETPISSPSTVVAGSASRSVPGAPMKSETS